MTVAEILLVLALAVVVFVDGFLTRKKVQAMTQALDDLTTSVTALETASAAAITEIQSLTAGGDTAALPAIKARIDAVAANLTAAATPPTA